MPLQGIANNGFAAATCFGMLVGETHAGAVVVELGRACGKQGRSGQRQRRFWQSLGNHQQWIYNMLRDESAVAADLCCCSRRVVFGIALYRCSRRKVLSVDLGCCSRSVEGLLALRVARWHCPPRASNLRGMRALLRAGSAKIRFGSRVGLDSIASAASSPSKRAMCFEARFAKVRCVVAAPGFCAAVAASR